MPEISATEPRRIQEPLSPLSLENYRDYAVQRKIIGFFASKGDTLVLKQPDYEVLESERTAFNGRLKWSSKDPIYTTDISKMIDFVPGPLDAGLAQEGYTSLAAQLDSSPESKARVASFMGVEGTLTPADIARFLEKNPNPVWVDAKAEKYLAEVRELKGSAASLEAEKSLKILLDGVYGDKMVYLRNFKLLQEKVFPRKVKRTTRKMKAAKVALAGLTAYGAIQATGNIATPILDADSGSGSYATEYVKPDKAQEPTPQPTPESQRFMHEKNIENKFGILLLNQVEGYERENRQVDPNDENLIGETLVMRWDDHQLDSIETLLPLVPEGFLKMISGRPLALSLWDYGESEEASARAHWHGGDMITFNQNAFKRFDLEGQFSLLIHELYHMNDTDDLAQKVEKILEDKSFLKNKTFNNKYGYGNDVFDALNTLGSFREGEHPEEGRAGFAQLYVRGYERFMRALGPVLDGGEFDPYVPKEELSVKYPRAHQIYDLYYNLIFQGKQYDDIARQLNPDFKYKDTSVIEATPAPIQPDNTTLENLSIREQGLSNIEIGILEQIVKSENFIEISPISRDEASEKQAIAPWGGQRLDSMSDILGWTQDGDYSNNWRMLHNVVYDTRNIQFLQGTDTPILSWGVNQVSIVKQFSKDQPTGYFAVPPDSRVFVRTLGYAPARYSLVGDEDKGWNIMKVGIDAEAIYLAKQDNIASVDGTRLPKTKPVVMAGHQPIGPLEAFPEIIVIPNSPTTIIENNQPEERQDLSNDFNVDVTDLTINQLTESQYEEIRKLLNLFPENFYYPAHPVQGWITNLVVLDGKREVDSDSVEILLTNGQLTYDPNESEHSISAAKEIARVLVERFDEHRDYEAQKRVIKFLGGKKFIKNPAELYPYFKGKGGGSEPAYVRYQLTGDDTSKDIDPSKLVEYLSGYYIQGWDKFYRAFAPFFDPKIDYFEDWGDKNTKTHELYQLIGAEYFGGTEYEIGTNGIQVVKDDLEFSPSSSSQIP